MRWGRLALFAACAAAGFAVAVVPTGSQARVRASSPVDELIQSCPTAAEIAAIDARVQIRIDQDPSAGTDVCGMTRLRLNAYNVLRVMQHLRFARPLPWTGKSLWDWFADSIAGVRFRNDTPYNFCCDPPRYINILTSQSATKGTTWIDPVNGTGLQGLAGVMIHEARHDDPYPRGHTCNPNDQTFDEQGAWAVQDEFFLWTGLYTTDSFLDAPGAGWTNQYRDGGLGFSGLTYCSLPSGDVSATSTVTPADPVTGARVTVKTTVANAGPGNAEDVFLYDPVPPGVTLVSATPTQGSCVTVAPTRVACDLGALAAGASADVSLALDVNAAAGTTIRAGGVFHQDSGPTEVSIIKEPLGSRNNEGPWSVTVAAPPTTTQATTTQAITTVATTTTVTTTPVPTKKPLPKCKRGKKPTKKHPCRK